MILGAPARAYETSRLHRQAWLLRHGCGLSFRAIGKALHRHPSTISAHIRRVDVQIVFQAWRDGLRRGWVPTGIDRFRIWGGDQ